MQKPNALVSVGAPALIVGLVVGVVVSHAFQGPRNDDNPVGFRAKSQSQMQQAQPSASPGSTLAAPTFHVTNAKVFDACSTSKTACTVTIIDILNDPPENVCEDGDGNPPCNLLPLPPAPPCPEKATCLNFSGSYSVQHVRRSHFLFWENGFEAHKATPTNLKGIIIIQ